MAQINTTMMSLTPAQIASLPADQQAQYLKGLTPEQQALVAQEAQKALITANRHFMRASVEKTAYCPVTGGSGVTATYSPGTTLYFDLPSVPGFAKGLLITYAFTAINPAAGAAATYAANAAAPWNIFSELQVLYNGPQIRTHPYFLKVLDQLKGFSRGERNRVIAGNNDTAIAANVVGATPLVVGSNNVWQGKMFLPLNVLGEDTVPGVLPCAGVGNKPQIKLTCTPNFIGQDPLINPVSPVGGTGHAMTTTTGSINVDMIYLDGTNFDRPSPLSLQWQNEPTIQYYWDTPLTPFSQTVIQRQTISTKLKHWYIVSVIIDGAVTTGATQFCNIGTVSGNTYTAGNLAGFEISPDQVGQQTFQNWNISNNVSIFDYYDRMIRRPFGQDLDDGVIVWAAAPGRGIIDSDNRNGIQAVNMYPGGFPAYTHSYQMNSYSYQSTIDGFAACTPRVETFLVSENSAGLKVS
jgi:hypothetical protein